MDRSNSDTKVDYITILFPHLLDHWIVVNTGVLYCVYYILLVPTTYMYLNLLYKLYSIHYSHVCNKIMYYRVILFTVNNHHYLKKL